MRGFPTPWRRSDSGIDLFDPDWYNARYTPELRSRKSAWNHFSKKGWLEGFNPHPLFDTRRYLARYPDVAEAGLNPLIHFLEHGGREGREPHPLFDSARYLALYEDVRADAGLNPLVHFLHFGWREGRSPHVLFDPQYYASQMKASDRPENPLLHFTTAPVAQSHDPHPLFSVSFYCPNVSDALSGAMLLDHFMTRGWRQGLSPHPLFDAERYLNLYPEVADSGVNPLIHFLDIGGREGRQPHRWFDAQRYLDLYEDVRSNPTLNPLVDYLKSGSLRGRSPHALFDTEHYRKQMSSRDRGQNPLVHFLTTPLVQGASPHPYLLNAFDLPEAATGADMFARLLDHSNAGSERRVELETFLHANLGTRLSARSADPVNRSLDSLLLYADLQRPVAKKATEAPRSESVATHIVADRFLPTNKRVDFTTNGDGRRYLVHGTWHHSEEEHTWSNGHVGLIAFSLDKALSPQAALRLDLRIAHIAVSPSFMSITLNGSQVYRQAEDISGSRDLTIAIDKGLRPPGTLNVLGLHFSELFRPADFGHHDPRVLGLGAAFMIIEDRDERTGDRAQGSEAQS